jgi:hypothetical protein
MKRRRIEGFTAAVACKSVPEGASRAGSLG